MHLLGGDGGGDGGQKTSKGVTSLKKKFFLRQIYVFTTCTVCFFLIFLVKICIYSLSGFATRGCLGCNDLLSPVSPGFTPSDSSSFTLSSSLSAPVCLSSGFSWSPAPYSHTPHWMFTMSSCWVGLLQPQIHRGRAVWARPAFCRFPPVWRFGRQPAGEWACVREWVSVLSECVCALASWCKKNYHLRFSGIKDILHFHHPLLFSLRSDDIYPRAASLLTIRFFSTFILH